MCGKKEGSDVQDGWRGGKLNKTRDRFRGIGNRASQLKKDGSSLDSKSCISDVLKCFGISRLSVSKVELLAGSMAGKHLVITCTLTVMNQEISTHVRFDRRATGIAFMHQDFAHHHLIALQGVKEERHVEVIDGRPIESGDITHIATVGMMIQDHKAQLPMFVTKLGYYPILVGITWLRLHDVAVWFASNTVTFVSQYCTTHCHDVPIRVQGVSAEPRDPVYPKDRAIFEPQIRPQRSFRGNIVMLNGSLFPQTV